ncbi:MAG: UDP-2,4-diacetamido-2,4,6-trideoxy-beta-L-altropyranose hydrolase [Deltaproteobacteria bacterium]|nr:UDP-2,4-diacetamido-2,4,6-trideoxy-beta-L-altropyranose hydrolase [Deltaproteobacteria bacterium]
MRGSLIIRADAGTRIGTGHLTRCLALAREWKTAGGEAEFLSRCESNDLRQLIRAQGFSLTTLRQSHPHPADLEMTSSLLERRRPAWVVLDGYHFDSAYQYRIKQAGCQLMVIDDNAHLDRYYADLLLNQNICAEELQYRSEPHTRLLMGTRYVLLRPEFLAWQGWRRETPSVARKILVTLGGSDPDNQTLKVLERLGQVKANKFEVTVVVGPGNPHIGKLQSVIRGSAFPVHLVRNPGNMAELMVWADMGVSAGGATCWEFAFMGLPGLILVVAENQRKNAETLNARGIAVNLGCYRDLSAGVLAEKLESLMWDAERRRAMTEKGQEIVDGNGASRVASAMAEAPWPEPDALRVRPAGQQDALLLWEWANDPSTRANSFQRRPIPLEEHMQWYSAKLESAGTRIWIIEGSSGPAAQIRYDRADSHTAEISFSVAPHCRGRGLGSKALTLTARAACEELGVRRLRGIVLSSNEASIRAFVKAGFTCVERRHIDRKACHVFVREYP